jgi:hypothetical protein
MEILSASFEILDQLASIPEQIQDRDFNRPSSLLSGSTIGQHLRHTIEFFLCLEKGFQVGVINYDKRDHDKRIENDRSLAISSINRIRHFIATHPHDRDLKLEVGYEQQQEKWCQVQTNYHRELAYNIEHAVHHMAIIKIGVREVAPYIMLPGHFGVAVSTVRFRSMTNYATN